MILYTPKSIKLFSFAQILEKFKDIKQPQTQPKNPTTSHTIQLECRQFSFIKSKRLPPASLEQPKGRKNQQQFFLCS